MFTNEELAQQLIVSFDDMLKNLPANERIFVKFVIRKMCYVAENKSLITTNEIDFNGLSKRLDEIFLLPRVRLPFNKFLNLVQEKLQKLSSNETIQLPSKLLSPKNFLSIFNENIKKKFPEEIIQLGPNRIALSDAILMVQERIEKILSNETISLPSEKLSINQCINIAQEVLKKNFSEEIIQLPSKLSTFGEGLSINKERVKVLASDILKIFKKTLPIEKPAIKKSEIIEIIPIKKTEKKREILIIGDGDFGHTVSAIIKHPDSSAKITTTELRSEDELYSVYKEDFIKHIIDLEEKGVETDFYVNAHTLHTDKRFCNKEYRYIHFVCPHSGHREIFGSKSDTAYIVEKFFESAKEIQEVGGRIYVVIVQDKKQAFYESFVYNIFNAPALNGYVLTNKHPFDEKRFFEYKHKKSYYNESQTDKKNQFSFEKDDLSYEEIKILTQPTICEETSSYLLPKIPTDSNSSGYETEISPIKIKEIEKEGDAIEAWNKFRKYLEKSKKNPWSKNVEREQKMVAYIISLSCYLTKKNTTKTFDYIIGEPRDEWKKIIYNLYCNVREMIPRHDFRLYVLKKLPDLEQFKKEHSKATYLVIKKNFYDFNPEKSSLEKIKLNKLDFEKLQKQLGIFKKSGLYILSKEKVDLLEDLQLKMRKQQHEQLSSIAKITDEDLAKKFIDLLLTIIEEESHDAIKNHTLLDYALLELFYLTNAYSQDSLTRLYELAEQKSNFLVKAYVLSMLMVHEAAVVDRHKKLIEALLCNLGYEPRLDWLVCCYLGYFDLSPYLIDKVYHKFFNNLFNDARLINKLLESTAVIYSKEELKKLPNELYHDIIIYRGNESGKYLINNNNFPIVNNTLQGGFFLSSCYTKDRINNSFKKIDHVGLCSMHVVLPVRQFIKINNTEFYIKTNPQEKDQADAFIKIGHLYKEGWNGCKRNVYKAIDWYKIPADYGNKEALINIVDLYAKGLGDFSCISVGEIMRYCEKLLQIDALNQETKKIALSCQALLYILYEKFDEAEKVVKKILENGKQGDFYYDFACINQAYFLLLNGEQQSAKNILSKIADNQSCSRYKFNLLGVIALINDEDEETDKYFRWAKKISARGEEKIKIILIYRALFFKKNHKYDQALECLNEILENFDDQDILSILHKALIYWETEKNNLFITQLKMAAQINYDHYDLELMLNGAIKSNKNIAEILLHEQLQADIFSPNIENLIVDNLYRLNINTIKNIIRKFISEGKWDNSKPFCKKLNKKYHEILLLPNKDKEKSLEINFKSQSSTEKSEPPFSNILDETIKNIAHQYNLTLKFCFKSEQLKQTKKECLMASSPYSGSLIIYSCSDELTNLKLEHKPSFDQSIFIGENLEGSIYQEKIIEQKLGLENGKKILEQLIESAKKTDAKKIGEITAFLRNKIIDFYQLHSVNPCLKERSLQKLIFFEEQQNILKNKRREKIEVKGEQTMPEISLENNNDKNKKIEPNNNTNFNNISGNPFLFLPSDRLSIHQQNKNTMLNSSFIQFSSELEKKQSELFEIIKNRYKFDLLPKTIDQCIDWLKQCEYKETDMLALINLRVDIFNSQNKQPFSINNNM